MPEYVIMLPLPYLTNYAKLNVRAGFLRPTFKSQDCPDDNRIQNSQSHLRIPRFRVKGNPFRGGMLPGSLEVFIKED
jgi:hypothetical protein